jgi:demethylmenaquinone methyltransferase/2-methoxy-6-polyprenyl-1,4-benzoquinol methylase
MLDNPSESRQKMSKGSTHFGYETVAVEDKARRVRGVFDSVAGEYDIMNDLMSGGLHRLWKHFTIEQAGVRKGHIALDLAGGTGDLAGKFADKVGSDGHVILADINHAMLSEGRRRLIDRGIAGNLSIAQVNAENLPFSENSFDVVTMAFGLRNVTDKEAALRSILTTLKPGGKALILEFSKPADVLRPAYDLYSFKVLPTLGKLVADDAASYQYLAESIRMHPDQETLLGMMKNAGFEKCRFHNLTGGVVALHVGYKI